MITATQNPKPKKKIQGNLYEHSSGDWFIVMFHLPDRLAVFHIQGEKYEPKLLKGERMARFLEATDEMKLINSGHFERFENCYENWIS